MATINPDVDHTQADDGSVLVITWETLTGTNDNGKSVVIPKFSDKTVTITGTFNTTTVKLQGTNDPLSVADGSANWFDLTDPQGNAISKSSAAMEQVTENPLRIRPYISASAGSDDIDVIVVARLANTLRQ